MSIEKRKLEHIMICLKNDVEHNKTNGFERVRLIGGEPISPEKVDMGTSFLGKHFKYPLFIEAMTGGAPGTGQINKNLAAAAEHLGIGMGVGSQRAAVENSGVVGTFEVRTVAPSMLLLGNLGMAQVVKYTIKEIEHAVESIGADALAIHINPIHEVAQPEGDKITSSLTEKLIDKIREIKSESDIKIVVKEVGFGISAGLAKKMESAGVDAIDVAGAGGTSWVKIEQFRGSKSAERLLNEGVPTAISLKECSSSVNIPIISSGGIRTGEEIAKSIAMGATLAGAALPFLKPSLESPEAVVAVAEKFIDELRHTMAGVGARKLTDLKGKYEYDR
ncbi:MAG: type 2 isopentenyl-diphosphate Delta-isomerase [Candidatus Aenigmatarchaeota archaeon]